MALAKAGRAHVHQTIDGHDLPVNHTTRRAGSPYVLLLTKRSVMFQQAAAERRVGQRELRWLQKVACEFGSGSVG